MNNFVKNYIQNWIDIIRWSPSGGNIQPWEFDWSFDATKNIIEFSICLSDPIYEHKSYTDTRLAGAIMSLGTAANSLTEVLKIQGHNLMNMEFKTQNLTGPPRFYVEFQILIGCLQGTSHPNPTQLIEKDHIIDRCTNRELYSRRSIDRSILDCLKEKASVYPQIGFHQIQNSISRFSNILKELMLVRLHNSYLYSELMNEIYDSDKEPQRCDGLAMNTLGLPRFLLTTLKLVRRFHIHFRTKLINSITCFFTVTKPLKHSGAIISISHERNDELGWFELGYAFQAIWLESHRHHLSLQPFGLNLLLYNWHDKQISKFYDAYDHETLTKAHQRLSEIWGLDSSKPLMFFRIGYPLRKPIKSPRFPLTHFLKTGNLSQQINQKTESTRP